MSTISCDNMSFHYDDPFCEVFSSVSIAIDTAWRCAVVGRNGRGKTTLLDLVRGRRRPSLGQISVPCEVCHFPARTTRLERPTLQVIKDAVAPFARWEKEMARLTLKGDEKSLARYGEIAETFAEKGGYEIEAAIERELALIGMPSEILAQPFNTLSGGERTRALIVALFLKKNTYPLIDEPTNHLDLAGRMYLAEYLAKKPGFMLVSHDRHLLDGCADHILSIDGRGVKLHSTDFVHWREQMALEEEHERRRDARLRRQIRSLEHAARQRRTWSQRKEKEKIGASDKGFVSHQAARQMKRALSIERRLQSMLSEKKQLLRGRDKERHLKLDVDAAAPDFLLSAGDVAVDLGGRKIFADLSFTVQRGERVAVVGPNGCGKITLLRAIAGEVSLADGSLHVPAHIKIVRAYQTPRWQEGDLRTLLQREGIEEPRFRTILGSMGVTGEVFERPLETFSQGERKKVDLCRSFLEPSHLLLWDEPLNYIDLLSREQIEEVVLSSKPTLLFVEHDRWFIERVATSVLDMG